MGGDANSATGKAFITAIKGKLYEADGSGTAADLSKSIPVADNGDFPSGSYTLTFVGVPSATTAYYRITESNDSVTYRGLIIKEGKLWQAAFKKSRDQIAEDMGYPDSSKAPSDKQADFQMKVFSLENIDLSKTASGLPAGEFIQ